MSKMHTLHNVNAHLSPAQAAQLTGVSRWTIMRAIKNQDLLAKRNNQNHWCIDPDDLNRWRPSTVRTVDAAHTVHTPEMLAHIASLEAENSQLRERLLEVQVDREAWREMAQRRRGWWPWG